MGRGKHLSTKIRELLRLRIPEGHLERRKAMQKARQKRRPKCRCAAYPWPHRPKGGLCRCPDPPLETWKGRAGKVKPVGVRYRGLYKTLCRQHNLHPIRDREIIERELPRLYVEFCRKFWPARYQQLVQEGRIDDQGRLKVSPIVDK